MELISGSELARRIGVTPTAVIRARNRGRIAFADPERKLYADPEVRAAFRKAAAPILASPPAAVATGSDPQIRTWYDRRQKALTLTAERELALLEGRSLDAGAAKAAWTRELTVMRSKLLAIPTRAAARMPPGMQVKVDAILTELIHEALEEIASPQGNGHDD